MTRRKMILVVDEGAINRQLLADEPERNLHILSANVERFKLVNDLFGTDGGISCF